MKNNLKELKKVVKRFKKWLKVQNVGGFHEYAGDDGWWGYYRDISGFVDGVYINTMFSMKNQEISVDFEYGENINSVDLSLDEFLKIFNNLQNKNPLKKIEKARRKLYKWMIKKGATNIREYIGDDNNCKFYRGVSFFIGEDHYNIYFKKFYNKKPIVDLAHIKAQFLDKKMSVKKFLKFLKKDLEF